MSIINQMAALKDCGLNLLVGDLLGSGATRNVYALQHNPDLVLKLEYADKKFCNVAEYDIWETVKGTPLARFFAPVVSIDSWAGALIMKRTTPITDEQFRKRVNKLPGFLDDNHPDNFGLYKGRIVCHDYGFHAAIEQAVKGGRMKTVKHDD